MAYNASKDIIDRQATTTQGRGTLRIGTKNTDGMGRQMLSKTKIIVIATLVSASIGGVLFLFSGPSKEEKSLTESMIRLRSSIELGMSFVDYRRLVNEVNTQAKLAEHKIKSSNVIYIEYAIKRASSAGAIWGETISGSCRENNGTRTYDAACAAVIKAHLDLLKIADGDNAKLECVQKTNNKALVSDALSVVDKSMSWAIGLIN